MESLELVVYLSIAIIVGMLTLGIITGWDYFGAFEGFRQMMSDDASQGFQKVDRYAFAGKLYNFFGECVSRDENLSMSLYLEESGLFSKADLFTVYKSFGWCDTIQSAEQGCGYREDLSMGTLALPKVVTINCTASHLEVS
jgi:hypothetical protein